MVLSYALFYVRLLNAITELNKFPSFLSCPFLHSDSYSSDIMLLNNMIKRIVKKQHVRAWTILNKFLPTSTHTNIKCISVLNFEVAPF